MNNKKKLTSEEKTIILCVAFGILTVVAIKKHNKKIFKKGYAAAVDDVCKSIFDTNYFAMYDKINDSYKYFICDAINSQFSQRV